MRPDAAAAGSIAPTTAPVVGGRPRDAVEIQNAAADRVAAADGAAVGDRDAAHRVAVEVPRR